MERITREGGDGAIAVTTIEGGNAMFRIIAVTFTGRTLARDFESEYHAVRVLDSITESREALARYRSVSLVDEYGDTLFTWHGVTRESALGFYESCRELWHDGAVSERLIAEVLNVFPSTVKLMINACLAWDLSVSKANGLYVF